MQKNSTQYALKTEIMWLHILPNCQGDRKTHSAQRPKLTDAAGRIAQNKNMKMTMQQALNRAKRTGVSRVRVQRGVSLRLTLAEANALEKEMHSKACHNSNETERKAWVQMWEKMTAAINETHKQKSQANDESSHREK